MPISDRVRKILWGRSGNRCAICRHELVVDATTNDDDSVIGDECHIVSSKPKGPRHDATIIDFDDLDNLILLCRIHHKVIDDQVATYSVLRLQQIKEGHEAWVLSSLESKTSPGRNEMADDKKFTIVTSHNQSGGITAGTVHINNAPAPTLNLDTVFVHQKQGSEFLSRFAISVESPYPPASLYLEVKAPSIKGIQVIPQRTGMFTLGHSGTRNGMAFTTIQNPYGLMHLDVVTSEKDRPSIEYDFQ